MSEDGKRPTKTEVDGALRSNDGVPEEGDPDTISARYILAAEVRALRETIERVEKLPASWHARGGNFDSGTRHAFDHLAGQLEAALRGGR